MSQSEQEVRRAAIQRKIAQSYKEKDDSGQFKSIFIESPGLKFWKCANGEHLIDIIDYKAGPNDPKTPEGEWTYVLIIFVHYGVGVNQDGYICMARTYGKRCPICEYREELRKAEDYDEDLVKSLNPKKRCFYNVLVSDNEKEQAKGVQIWDASHWLMERHLVIMAKIPTRTGQATAVEPYVLFSNSEVGKSIAFERIGAKMTTDFIGHRFVDRDYTIPPEFVGFSIDSFLRIPTYEEVHAAFYGTEEESELGPPPDPNADIPNFPPPEPKVEPPPIPLKTRKPLAVPAPTGTSVPTPSTTPGPARLTPKATANQCPVNGNFGVDCEKLEACNGCPEWEPCSAQADVLASAANAEAGKTQVPPVRVAKAPIPAPRPQVPTPAPRPPIPIPTAGPRRGPFPKKA